MVAGENLNTSETPTGADLNKGDVSKTLHDLPKKAGKKMGRIFKEKSEGNPQLAEKKFQNILESAREDFGKMGLKIKPNGEIDIDWKIFKVYKDAWWIDEGSKVSFKKDTSSIETHIKYVGKEPNVTRELNVTVMSNGKKEILVFAEDILAKDENMLKGLLGKSEKLFEHPDPENQKLLTHLLKDFNYSSEVSNEAIEVLKELIKEYLAKKGVNLYSERFGIKIERSANDNKWPKKFTLYNLDTKEPKPDKNDLNYKTLLGTPIQLASQTSSKF